jgi:hypothetical protein
MATLLKVLNNLADIKSAGGVALRVGTQGFKLVETAEGGIVLSGDVMRLSPPR